MIRFACPIPCPRPFRVPLAAALALAMAAGATAAPPPNPPAPPYYSVQLVSSSHASAALEVLGRLAEDSWPRAEQRGRYYAVRVGAWASRAYAEAALPDLQRRFSSDARILKIENPAPWLLAGGETLPAESPPRTVEAVIEANEARRVDLASAGEDLTQLSLDDLLNIEVTSVSKRAEPLAEAAAAIFVLTGDEIRRAGVRTIADALRLVPGLQVYRTGAQAYQVTSRGFSGDKLEVVMDGRSVYTPLTSTVFWDVLDTNLLDIERIEVIRGPGATLWGANAVNGVINIVTKPSSRTRGTAGRAGGGNEERAFGTLRLGTALGPDADFRLYAKGAERDDALIDGADALDSVTHTSAGFRSDWRAGDQDEFTFQGDAYDGQFGTQAVLAANRVETDASGGNLLARWNRRLDAYGSLSVQAYYDHYDRFTPGLFEDIRDTYDLDIQHNLPVGNRSNVVWGLGFRESRDETGGTPLAVVFSPKDRRLQTFSAFLQDQVRLTDTLEVTLGSKFEENDLSGFEAQPSIHLGWQAAERVFTWSGISRAVRTPNRLDEDIAIFCPPPAGFPGVCGPGLFRLGNPQVLSEKVTAYEWGMRWWNDRGLSLDVATFFNDYEDLRSSEAGGPFFTFANKLEAESVGAELSAGWQPTGHFNARAFYALIKVDARTVGGGNDEGGVDTLEGGTPQQAAALRWSWQPLPDTSFDGMLRFVDSRPALGVSPYTDLTLRAAWAATPNLELALVGDNLLDQAHPESGTVEVERSVFVELRWDWQ